MAPGFWAQLRGRPAVAGIGLALCMMVPKVASAAEKSIMRTKVDHDRTASSTVYLEAFGPGSVYSINYDHIVFKMISVRVGFSYAPVKVGHGAAQITANLVTVPMVINALLGARGHYFEAGIGPVLRFYGERESNFVEDMAAEPTEGVIFGAAGTFLLGYRYNPLASGFNFRAGFSPFFGDNAGFSARTRQVSSFSPWGYVSVGMSF